MRELSTVIEFVAPCLGDRKMPDGKFVFLRDTSDKIMFMPSWHYANMRMAAKLLNRHQDEVRKIRWHITIDGEPQTNRWHRTFRKQGTKTQFVLYEAFQPGERVTIYAAVPASIPNTDFELLMQKAGEYCGLSPWKPGEYGFFKVISVLPRYATEGSSESVEHSSESC